MTALIRANRPEVSRQFPVLGFTIRTGVTPSWVEVAIATDPTLLFGANAKARRSPANFYSSRVSGLLPAEKGELVYLVPPAVLSRFAGQTKIYYALAVYRQGDFRNPEVIRVAPEAMPYVQVSNSFTGARRSLMEIPNRNGGWAGRGGGYIEGDKASLEWAGDVAVPGEMTTVPAPALSPSSPPATPTPSPSTNGQTPSPAPQPSTPTMQGFAFAYDDGFGPFPEPSGEGDVNDDGGIEEPIPDEPSGEITQGLAKSVTLDVAPEYPQASRFVPAASVNFRRVTRPRTIDRIIIHITDGDPRISRPISYFQNPNQRNRRGEPIHVSAHYVIGQDGEVVQMVRHNDIARHAHTANSTSIGIEHVANTHGLNPTEAEYRASAALVNWLCQQYNIPMDRNHIQGHSEADPHTGHRGCPNAVWNWDYFMGLVTSGTASGLAYGFSQAQLAVPLSAEIPLDPGCGGRSIMPSLLEMGDIILSTTSAFISNAIRRVTSAPVSHAMIYIGDGQVVEAIGSGVRLVSLEAAIADATVAVAFRVAGLTLEQALRIRDFLGRQLDRAYDYWSIVRQALFQLDRTVWCSGKSGEEYTRCLRWAGRINLGTESNDTFFCSELVLAAYADAGLPLTDTPPHWGSPADLAELRISGQLGYVGHLKAEVPTSQGLGLSHANRNGNGYARISADPSVRPFSGQSFDVNWSDVQLVPQMTGMSCWAAAASMVVGWRDGMSIDPAEVARGAGQWAAYTAGLNPSDRRQLATAWGLIMEPPQCYTVEGFRQLLEQNGPLWIGIAVPSGHAVVVTGLYGDGTEDGTYARINDPWPPGQGSRTEESFRQLMQEYENRMTTDPGGDVNVQILHAGGRSGISGTQSVALGRQADVGYAASSSSYSRGLGGSPLPADGIERMRQEFVNNALAGANRRNCIAITNAGLRQLYGALLRNPDGFNKSLGSTIQDTMAALQGYGLALTGRVFEFLDASGRLTRGVARPDRLQTSVESALLNLAEANQMSGWYAFGLSIMDGYHSVILGMTFSGIGNAMTRIYWADQIYGGWDDVTGQLDARITERTQTWWDPLPANRKARTRATVWQLLPDTTATTQGLSTYSRSMTDAVTSDDDPAGIEGYEEEVYVGSRGLTQTCSDEFCPVAFADTASSAHFSLAEFTNRDGTEVPERFRGNVQRVMDNLEVLRSELGDRSIRITSGYRSCNDNQRVDGAQQSRHLCGQAADIQVEGVEPVTVHSTIERLIASGQMQQGGLGLYDTFVHYDIRGTGQRWDRRRQTPTASARSLTVVGGIDWCQMRQEIARIARAEEARWTRPNGTKIRESDPSMLPILQSYWATVPGFGTQAALDAARRSAANDDDWPWSAAFICYVMHTAGVRPDHGFAFGPRHLAYIVEALRNRERGDRNRPFWLRNEIEIEREDTPRPGDLICFNRCVSQPGAAATPECREGKVMTTHSYSSLRQQYWGAGHENRPAGGSSHTALVVGIVERNGTRFVETIGGNEDLNSQGSSVRLKSNIPLNQSGGILNPREHHIFGLIKITAC